MARPPFEVADVLRRFGERFYRRYPQSPHVCSTLSLIKICRTRKLGGHIDLCPVCNWSQPSYNSCRNRHCPKCQTMAKESWMEKRMQELLPVPYYHCVFTLPHEFNPLILQNKKVMLDLLFQTVQATLMEFSYDPDGKMRGRPGFIAVLHTWNQKLLDHFHLHIIMPGGVLRGEQWIKTPCQKFLYPVKAMSKVFAGTYREELTKLYKAGTLEFHGKCAPLEKPAAFYALLRQTKTTPWNVYAKRPFAGPEHVFEYLGRYTHRVAISNHRILNIDDQTVTISTRNRETNEVIPVPIEGVEFIRRFALHILPKSYVKIRFFGFLTHTERKASLQTIRAALDAAPPEPLPEETWWEKIERLTGTDVTLCPRCGCDLVIDDISLTHWEIRNLNIHHQPP